MSLHHLRNFPEESRFLCRHRPSCFLSSHLRFLPERYTAPNSNKGVSEQGCPWIVDTSSGVLWPSSGVEQVQRQRAPPRLVSSWGKQEGRTRCTELGNTRAPPPPRPFPGPAGWCCFGNHLQLDHSSSKTPQATEGSSFLQGSVAGLCVPLTPGASRVWGSSDPQCLCPGVGKG